MDTVVAVQVRHKAWGVFQGHCLGMGFWHPMSEMPEQGFFEFPNSAEAQEFLEMVCVHDQDRKIHEFVIEPFDRAQSDALIQGVTAPS